MMSPGQSCRRRAFTMAEAAVCIVIVGVMLVAVLNAAAFARTVDYRMAMRQRGMLLARELLAEVTAQAYADPESGTAVFGLEAGETGTGSRALWDDVDDYDGLNESPPRDRDGTDMSDLAEWKWQVRIERLSSSNPTLTVASESGLKLCTVIVSRNGQAVARLASVRSAAWMPNSL